MKKVAHADKIIIIVGPTASGKSDLAIRIAKKIGGEIISADSRQIYIGMDVGTGKVLRDKTLPVPNAKIKAQNAKLSNPFYSEGILHHLLDVASPKTDFSAGKFKKLASKKIKEIVARGKTPIIAGGTGFWIDALLYNWPIPGTKLDKKLRLQLEKQTVKKLFAKLKKLDPARAITIDPYNKRRLIRALEIIMTTGKKVPQFNLRAFYSKNGRQYMQIGSKELEIKIIALNPPLKKREQKIYKRLGERLKSGMAKEIKKLHQSRVSWKRLDNFGLEYRFVSRYLRGLITYDEMVGQTYRAIRKYAIRQMRWFKRNKNIHWLVPPLKMNASFIAKIMSLILKPA